jgi:hypothetical protein
LISPLFTTQDSLSSISGSQSQSQSRIELEVPTTSEDNVTNTIQTSAKGIYSLIVSYDICKNNEHVAQLTLPRLCYRLGEPVTAVFDFSKSSIPVYNVSVYLEAHESVANFYAAKSKIHIANHTRLCYGEFHQNTLNSKRAVVSLNISTKGTPDYNSTAGILKLKKFLFNGVLGLSL